MKNVIFIIVLLWSITSYSQQQSFVVTYRIITPSSHDSDDEIRNIVLDNMQYSFAMNETACYLNFNSVPSIDGINAKRSGDEHIFINYSNKTAFYKIDGDCLKFTSTKFKKVNLNETLLGLKVNKYVSQDKNLEIYTTDALPWFVQPCLFTSNELGEGVIKFVNHSANFGFMMVARPTRTKEIEITSTLKRVASTKNCESKSMIQNPFLK